MNEVGRMTLFTIGYENKGFDDLLNLLVENRVEVLADIRAVPYSRRKEFSKKNLASELPKRGIEYIHMAELGSPEDLRKKVKEDDDYGYFFQRYADYLKTQHDSLEKVTEIAKKRAVCLFCYERDVNRCHRRAVAEKLRDLPGSEITISHL